MLWCLTNKNNKIMNIHTHTLFCKRSQVGHIVIKEMFGAYLVGKGLSFSFALKNSEIKKCYKDWCLDVIYVLMIYIIHLLRFKKNIKIQKIQTHEK